MSPTYAQSIQNLFILHKGYASVQNGRSRRPLILQCTKYFSMRYTQKLKLPFELLLKVSFTPLPRRLHPVTYFCLFLRCFQCNCFCLLGLPPTCFNSFAGRDNAGQSMEVFLCLCSACRRHRRQHLFCGFIKQLNLTTYAGGMWKNIHSACTIYTIRAIRNPLHSQTMRT